MFRSRWRSSRAPPKAPLEALVGRVGESVPRLAPPSRFFGGLGHEPGRAAGLGRSGGSAPVDREAMPAAEGGALDAVLSAGASPQGYRRSDVPARRAISTDPLLARAL